MSGYDSNMNALTSLMTSALFDPSYNGAQDLRNINFATDLESNNLYSTDRSNSLIFHTDADGKIVLNPATASMAKAAPYFSPEQLGGVITNTIRNGSSDSENNLAGLNMGMDSYLDQMYSSIMSFSKNLAKLNLGLKFPGSISSGGKNGSGVVSNSDLLDKKITLIEAYAKKSKTKIDTDKIKTTYADDTEAGIKYCDGLIKKFNSATLKSTVEGLYNADLKQNSDAGKSISDEWVKSVQQATLNKPSINSYAVNSANVLEVISGFISNGNVLNGSVKFSDIFKDPNVYNQIANALMAKADDIAQGDVGEETKKDINAKLATLKKAASKDQVIAFYRLFDSLKLAQAKASDKDAYADYGADSATGSVSTAQNTYHSQKKAYEHRKVLNTKI